MVDTSRTADTQIPEPVAYVRDLLVGFTPTWCLCGGWAADAWLGRRTREHWDVDIAVFHGDQRAVFEDLAGWVLVGHDPNVPEDTTEPVERSDPRQGEGNLTSAEAEARTNAAGTNAAGNNAFRPRDEQDLFALLPILTRTQRSWLRDSLGTVRRDHPWLAHLES